MHDLFRTHIVPVLATVALEEPVVGIARQRLKDSLEQAVRPLLQYLATFAKFLPLIQLDVDKYTEEVKAKEGDLDVRCVLPLEVRMVREGCWARTFADGRVCVERSIGDSRGV